MAFFITMVRLESAVIEDKRCCAFFDDLDTAQSLLSSNEQAVSLQDYDGSGSGQLYFTHAVIESMTAGLYPEATSEHWYAWSTEEKRFIAIDKPEEVEGLVNLALG